MGGVIPGCTAQILFLIKEPSLHGDLLASLRLLWPAAVLPQQQRIFRDFLGVNRNSDVYTLTCALQFVSWNEATAGEFTSNTWVSISHEQFDLCVSHILHLQNSSDESQTNTDACEEILNIAEGGGSHFHQNSMNSHPLKWGSRTTVPPLLLSFAPYCQLYIRYSMSRITSSTEVSFGINTCNHRIHLEASSPCTTVSCCTCRSGGCARVCAAPFPWWIHVFSAHAHAARVFICQWKSEMNVGDFLCCCSFFPAVVDVFRTEKQHLNGIKCQFKSRSAANDSRISRVAWSFPFSLRLFTVPHKNKPVKIKEKNPGAVNRCWTAPSHLGQGGIKWDGRTKMAFKLCKTSQFRYELKLICVNKGRSSFRCFIFNPQRWDNGQSKLF